MQKIGITKCPCGHRGCTTFHLTGVGNFYQGSGFGLNVANLIADLLNENLEKLVEAEAKDNAQPKKD